MILVGGDRGLEPGRLPVGELLGAGAEQVPDAVERVALPAAVPECLLLNPASALIDRLGAELTTWNASRQQRPRPVHSVALLGEHLDRAMRLRVSQVRSRRTSRTGRPKQGTSTQLTSRRP